MNTEIEDLVKEVGKLRIRVARLENERTLSVTESSTVKNDKVKAGDRIRIINKIRKPASWPEEVIWTEEKERVGTVTRLIKDQVHFRTDNGRDTWRATKNVRKLATVNDKR
jgi:hypothetical protein